MPLVRNAGYSCSCSYSCSIYDRLSLEITTSRAYNDTYDERLALPLAGGAALVNMVYQPVICVRSREIRRGNNNGARSRKQLPIID